MRKALWTSAAALILSLAFTVWGGFSAWFSGYVSLPLASLLSLAAASVQMPVGEVLLIAGAPAVFLLLLWSAVRRRPPRRTAFALSLVFLMYAVLWVPLCHIPAKDAEPYETWRLIKLSRTLGENAEALRAETMKTEDAPSEAVLSKARDAVASLRLSNLPLSAPKFSQFPKILRTLKIAGLYVAWTGEAIISPEEPPYTLPFLASHELAHAAGIAREDEANFVAYRACMTGDARFRYAGTIYALRYAMDALRGIDLTKWFEVRRELTDGVRNDFAQIDDLGDSATGFTAFTDRAAEAFLQLSGQPAGLSSYTGMVNYLLRDVSLVDDPQTLQREDAVQYID